MNFFSYRKINITLLAILLAAVFFSGCSKSTVQQSTSNMSESATSGQQVSVKMLDIGQGDSILIKTNQKTVLIDTGDVDQRDKLVALLKKENVKTIDQLIITHPHADHLGGAYAVLKNFIVKEVYDNGQSTTTATYRTYLKLLKEKKIVYKQLSADDILDFGNEVKFKVFSPAKGSVNGDNLNNGSVVGKLSFGEFSMLFTGDAEAEVEKELTQKYGKELQSTILKSPHHGSKTSSNRNYLKIVKPEAVLISVGAGNDYKHPHQVTLNKYKDLKLKVYRTDLNGTITINTDGKTYQITSEK